eukprot:9749115-Prorocentrum_lima.AAC.1
MAEKPLVLVQYQGREEAYPGGTRADARYALLGRDDGRVLYTTDPDSITSSNIARALVENITD